MGGLAGWVLDVLASLGYVGIALLVALETFVPPIPSEVVLPAAGFLVAQGEMGFVAVVLAATLGSTAGAYGLYLLARRVGERRVDRWVERRGKWVGVDLDDLRRSRAWFARRGTWAVLVGRMVPAVRSLVSVPAGLANMPEGRFLALTALGSLAWNALLVYAGVALGANWRVIGPYYDRVETALWIVVGVGFAWRLLHKRAAARRARTRDARAG